MSKLVAAAAVSVLAAATALAPAAAAAPIGSASSARPGVVGAVPAAKTFKNCTALNKKYPHGVGRSKAVRDSTSGTPVTNFKVSKALYKANKKSDRDKDGIACEKR
jgi:hypothetical protein